jgi:predicted enzyme related to lactoylglutathione lyase
MAAAQLAHFAINADDVAASQAFYAAVFGFTFEPWGPPGFFHVVTGGARTPLMGALQQRRNYDDGTRVVGFEVTFAVDDVDTIGAVAVEHGGRVLMDKTTITGVGDLVWLADPAGNPVGAMRYDESAS